MKRPELIETHRQWGRTLKSVREMRGFTTQRALADQLGVTDAAVSNWERGVSAPRDYMRSRIAQVLECEPSVLFPISRSPEKVA